MASRTRTRCHTRMIVFMVHQDTRMGAHELSGAWHATALIQDDSVYGSLGHENSMFCMLNERE